MSSNSRASSGVQGNAFVLRLTTLRIGLRRD